MSGNKDKKKTTSHQRKWPTVIVNRKRRDCASTGNAFTFRYVPAVARLHMAFTVLSFILSIVHTHAINLAKIIKFSRFKQILFINLCGISMTIAIS